MQVLTEIINSPYVVALGAFVVTIVAVVAGIVSNAYIVRLRAEQRMVMLARGLSIPEIKNLLG
jgi:hypothetical protein